MRLVKCRIHCGRAKDMDLTVGNAVQVGRSSTGYELWKVGWNDGCFGYTSNPPSHLHKIYMEVI